MTTVQEQNSGIHNFTLSSDIFMQPDLDIYSQMVYIVLRACQSESSFPSLADISAKGRMDAKQATKAMQDLADCKIIQPKLFRQIVGEFRDDRLSWAAKGLLTYCKDHPDMTLEELLDMSDQSGESIQSIRKSLHELQVNGYLEEFPGLSELATLQS